MKHVHGGFHAEEHAVGGDGRRVAAAAHGFGKAGDEVGFPGDDFHVVGGGAYVFGCDVAAVQAFHIAAEPPQERLRFIFRGITDDDRLGAAQVQPRDGGFIGHAPRQPQHIPQGFFFRSVRIHPQPAQTGPQHGAVNGDDGA